MNTVNVIRYRKNESTHASLLKKVSEFNWFFAFFIKKKFLFIKLKDKLKIYLFQMTHVSHTDVGRLIQVKWIKNFTNYEMVDSSN